MPEAGEPSTLITEATLVDELIGNRNGETVRIPLARAAQQMSIDKIEVNKETRGELYSDLAWAAGTRGAVFGDATEAWRGVYLKTGASGAGSWSRIGDLPQTALATAQLAAKADQTALTAETDAREAAENLGAIIRLANVVGTGDAVTADVPAAQAHITMGAGQLVVWRQPADNSGNVTLTVGGIGYGVRSRGGSDLPAGALVEASRYVGVVHSTGGEPRIRVLTALVPADIGAASDALAGIESVAEGRIVGRAAGGGSGAPVALTPAQVRALINVADGATANATDAQLRDRTTHTGAQAISTVTGLQAALDGKAIKTYAYVQRGLAASGTLLSAAVLPGGYLVAAASTHSDRPAGSGAYSCFLSVEAYRGTTGDAAPTVMIQTLTPLAMPATGGLPIWRRRVDTVNGADAWFDVSDRWHWAQRGVLASGSLNAAQRPGAYLLLSSNTYTDRPVGVPNESMLLIVYSAGATVGEGLPNFVHQEMITLSPAATGWRRWRRSLTISSGAGTWVDLSDYPSESYVQRGPVADYADVRTITVPGAYLIDANGDYVGLPDGWDEAIPGLLEVQSYGGGGGHGTALWTMQRITMLTPKSGSVHGYYRQSFVRFVNSGDPGSTSLTAQWTAIHPSPSADGYFWGVVIAALGDSVTEFGTWPEQMSRRLGATLVKGGFGGARMGAGSPLYDPFSAYQISRRILDDDWSVLTDAADALYADNGDDNRPQAAALAAQDWSLVDYVLVNFGTNDWSAGIPIGSTHDTGGATSFRGAINELIDNIRTAIPAVRIIFGTPIYRSVGGSGGGSDVATNGLGLTLAAYADAIIERARAHHIEVVDLLRHSGVNGLTAATLLADGVHPTAAGYALLADRWGDALTSALAPELRAAIDVEADARRGLIDAVGIDGDDDADPAGLVTTDSGQIVAKFRRDGALELPALRLGGGAREIAATADGGVDLGPLALSLHAGGDGILALLTDPAGRVGAYLTDDLRLITPSADPARDRPRTLSAQIGDPLTSIRINMIGDSITWGRTLAANSDPAPRTGALSDPRDNLDSPSWANLLRRWLTWAALGTTAAITAAAPGRGEARVPQYLRPYDDPRLIRAGLWDTRALAGSVYGTVLALAPGASLDLRFRGDRIDLTHAVTTALPSATAAVTLDGAALAPLAHGGPSAATGEVYEVVAAYGDHRLRVVNTSATELLIEQVAHHRQIVVQNDGINGRQSSHWLPGGLLLDASLAPGYDWVICQIGTNDRINVQPAVYAANLSSILRAIRASGVAPVLVTANACPVSDATGGFAQTMAQVSSAAAAVAAALGIPHLDQYRATLLSQATGAEFLADGLHPNENGHKMMAETLINAIIDGDI